MATLSDVSLDYGQNSSDTVTDASSAIQKLVVVLSTPYDSAKWKKRFGCRLTSHLFDPYDKSTAGWIGTDIEEAISNPYNQIADLFENFRVEVTLSGGGVYKCQLYFDIVLDNRRIKDVMYDFSLKSPLSNPI